MITIKHSNGMIEVYSPYSEKLVEIFRSLTNRRWNREKKCWLVGLSDLKELFIPAIEKEGFEYQFDESYLKMFGDKKGKIEKFNLRFPLYPFQKEGATKLVGNPSFALFHDMGLGKTIMTIAGIDKLKRIGNANKVLIICPNSLKKQWFDEIRKFSSMGCLIVEGNKTVRRNLWEKKCRIKIINYELVRYDDYPFEHEWDILVLDEASRIKNSFAKTTRYIKKIRAKRKYVLTGTPVENAIQDLFSIFEFLNPFILGNYTRFKEKFLVTQRRNFGGNSFEEVIGYKNIDDLKKEILPYYLRQTKEEVLSDLPEIVEEKIWIELNGKERRLYNIIKRSIEDKIDNIKTGNDEKKNSILGDISLLRVVCNGEVCLKWSNTDNEEIQKEQIKMGESSSKTDECMLLIRSIINQNGDKIIVFSDYTSPLKELEDRLKKEGIWFSHLYGEVKNREIEIEEFKRSSKVRVMLAQIKTGGYGLNLQEANHIILFNNPWNPAVRQQAISRAHRSGQKKTVFVYDLIARNSIEEKVLDALKNKTQLSEMVIAKNIKKYI